MAEPEQQTPLWLTVQLDTRQIEDRIQTSVLVNGLFVFSRTSERSIAHLDLEVAQEVFAHYAQLNLLEATRA